MHAISFQVEREKAHDFFRRPAYFIVIVDKSIKEESSSRGYPVELPVRPNKIYSFPTLSLFTRAPDLPAQISDALHFFTTPIAGNNLENLTGARAKVISRKQRLLWEANGFRFGPFRRAKFGTPCITWRSGAPNVVTPRSRERFITRPRGGGEGGAGRGD